MKILEMSFGDLERVTILAEQLGYSVSLNEVQKHFGVVSKSPTDKLYVAKDKNDEVVGWIQVNKEPPTLLSEPRAEVAALVVDENCRGKGIGRALLEVAESWATTNNLSLVRIRSNVIRNDAHKFYQKQGYVIKKSWHLFTKSLSANP